MYSDYESCETEDTSSDTGSEISTDTSSRFIQKKMKKKAKNAAGTEMNKKSKETRHQRKDITTRNSKKQGVNKENQSHHQRKITT